MDLKEAVVNNWYNNTPLPSDIIMHVFEFIIGGPEKQFHNFKMMTSYRVLQNGVFATENIPQGTILFKMTDPYPTITETGSRVNHSSTPNSHLIYYEDNQELVTTQDIKTNEEITLDYDLMPGFKSSDPTITDRDPEVDLIMEDLEELFGEESIPPQVPNPSTSQDEAIRKIEEVLKL